MTVHDWSPLSLGDQVLIDLLAGKTKVYLSICAKIMLQTTILFISQKSSTRSLYLYRPLVIFFFQFVLIKNHCKYSLWKVDKTWLACIAWNTQYFKYMLLIYCWTFEKTNAPEVVIMEYVNKKDVHVQKDSNWLSLRVKKSNINEFLTQFWFH